MMKNEIASASDLIAALVKAKVKKVEIARECDVNVSSVYHWGEGNQSPGSDHYRMLVKMCRERLSLEDLLSLGIATRGSITI